MHFFEILDKFYKTLDGLVIKHHNDRDRNKYDAGGEVRVRTDEIKLILTERIGDFVNITGRNLSQDAVAGDSTWQLKREIDILDFDLIQYASGGGYDQKFADRFATGTFRDFAIPNEFAVLFNGIDQYLEAPDDPSLGFENNIPFSYSLSLKSSDNTGDQRLINKIGIGNVAGYAILKNDSTGFPTMILQNKIANRIEVTSSTDIADGSYHSFIATYDGSGLAAGVQFYLDGVAMTMVTVADNLSGNTILNSNTLKFGSLDGSQQFLNATMDEPSLFDIALTQAQVDELLSSPPTANNLISVSFINRLVSWWRNGDGDTFSTVQDKAGDNDLTMFNMDSTNFVEDPAP